MTLIESKLSPVRWPDWFSCNDMTMPPRPQPSFDRAALVIAAAVDGLGVALESVRFAERELVSGELVILGEWTVQTDLPRNAFRVLSGGRPQLIEDRGIPRLDLSRESDRTCDRRLNARACLCERLAQDVRIADMVRQQEHQLGIHEVAFFVG